MQQVDVTCTNTGKTIKADVLSRSDKHLRVVLVGTELTLNMSRSDLRALFVGRSAGLEFTSNGK